MKTYPEHEKLHKIKDQSQSIGDFLEWLSSQNIYLAEEVASGWFYPTNKRNTYILATYFEIDLDKLEEEKIQMLKEFRESQEIQCES